MTILLVVSDIIFSNRLSCNVYLIKHGKFGHHFKTKPLAVEKTPKN